MYYCIMYTPSMNKRYQSVERALNRLAADRLLSDGLGRHREDEGNVCGAAEEEAEGGGERGADGGGRQEEEEGGGG